jgi:hypothetical protein
MGGCESMARGCDGTFRDLVLFDESRERLLASGNVTFRDGEGGYQLIISSGGEGALRILSRRPQRIYRRKRRLRNLLDS